MLPAPQQLLNNSYWRKSTVTGSFWHSLRLTHLGVPVMSHSSGIKIVSKLSCFPDSWGYLTHTVPGDHLGNQVCTICFSHYQSQRDQLKQWAPDMHTNILDLNAWQTDTGTLKLSQRLDVRYDQGSWWSHHSALNSALVPHHLLLMVVINWWMRSNWRYPCMSQFGYNLISSPRSPLCHPPPSCFLIAQCTTFPLCSSA